MSPVVAAAERAPPGIGGFLREAGTLDFAGGIVVHINAGIADLVTALVLGKRLGYPDNVAPPHNLPFAVLGTGILWFVITGPAGGLAAVTPAAGFVKPIGAIWIQFKAAGITVIWSRAATWVLLKAVDAALGLRASEHEERVGLQASGLKRSSRP